MKKITIAFFSLLLAGDIGAQETAVHLSLDSCTKMLSPIGNLNCHSIRMMPISCPVRCL